ncbi:MAG: AsmA family protein [Methylophilaceae bacterium]
MKKMLKISLLIAVSLLALLLIAVAIFAATFNPNDYKPLIVKLVQEKKQRTLNIEGDIQLAFWPKLGADLGRISLSEHASDKEFASVKGLKVSLALLPLLKKELVVDTIYVDGAKANIVRFKDGTTNIDDLLSQEEGESEQVKFDIDGVNVTDSAVSFTDEPANTKYALNKFNLKAGHVALGVPFDLAADFAIEASKPTVLATADIQGNFMADPEAKHFVAKGLNVLVKGNLATLNDAEVKLAGDIDAKPENMEVLVDSLKLAATGTLDGAKVKAEFAAPSLVIQNDKVSGKTAKLDVQQEKGSDTLKAKLQIADISGSPTAIRSSAISGEISADQGARHLVGKFSSPFTGNIEKLIFDLPKLVGNVDVKDPAIPEGSLKADFVLNVHADIKQEKVSSNFNLAVDESKIKGMLGINRFAQPTLDFDIDIDKLDADRYIVKSAGSAKPATTEQKTANPKTTDTPIDLSGLKQLNANGELRIGWLKLANVRSTNVRIKLKAHDGVAELMPFSASLYEGTMNGALKVDARSTPNISFKQNMKNIAIGPLLTDAINNDVLNGKGNLDVDITTQGATVNALKKDLNGTLAMNLADGTVKGIDVAGTLRSVKDRLNVLKGQSKIEGDKSKKTDFSELLASFNIKNGVAHNDDLSMKAPLFRITGSGDIDIYNETIDYLAKPTVVNTLKGQGGADLEAMNGLTIPIKLTGTFAKPEYAIDFAGLAAAVARNKLLDGVGGNKGDAIKGLLGDGNKEDALKSLLGNKKKNETKPADASQAPAPAKSTSKEKAEKKLNKLLGF